ncbi:hypothetical protein LX32DRAFT_213802 [Colletotrichum zoysiae]|uniref:Uncharacterized protein n=1 Tax=Colletotrichum zoysiae TaxID=1216348 RepID=A0AAD9H5E2_9PEZI|nr:hypothetical protein LX32DRAFT_213802 [Colletotrichum zoysiae]
MCHAMPYQLERRSVPQRLPARLPACLPACLFGPLFLPFAKLPSLRISIACEFPPIRKRRRPTYPSNVFCPAHPWRAPNAVLETKQSSPLASPRVSNWPSATHKPRRWQPPTTSQAKTLLIFRQQALPVLLPCQSVPPASATSPASKQSSINQTRMTPRM